MQADAELYTLTKLAVFMLKHDDKWHNEKKQDVEEEAERIVLAAAKIIIAEKESMITQVVRHDRGALR